MTYVHITAIKAAHARVKTGADFPRYIQEIKALGLRRYEYFVTDGNTVYYGDNGHQVQSLPIYEEKAINTMLCNSFKTYDYYSSTGQTAFLTFCQQAADAGVEKWVIDTERMVCTYLDRKGGILVEDPFHKVIMP
ncbi:DUF1398 domain-containing protein, partial [Chitinophaga pinensis]